MSSNNLYNMFNKMQNLILKILKKRTRIILINTNMKFQVYNKINNKKIQKKFKVINSLNKN